MMTSSNGPESRLSALGIVLEPTSPIPRASNSFRTWSQTGNLVYLSGHGPNRGPSPQFVGKVGRELSEGDGYRAAREAAINMLATLKSALTTLDRVHHVVKLLGMVNCTEDFVRQSYVINGASELLVEVFGEAGVHSRSAVGMQSLPNGMPVELEMIVEVTRPEETPAHQGPAR